MTIALFIYGILGIITAAATWHVGNGSGGLTGWKNFGANLFAAIVVTFIWPIVVGKRLARLF